MAHKLLPFIRRMAEVTPDAMRLVRVNRITALPPKDSRLNRCHTSRQRLSQLASHPGQFLRTFKLDCGLGIRQVRSKQSAGLFEKVTQSIEIMTWPGQLSLDTPQGLMNLVGLAREGGIGITAELTTPVTMLSSNLPLPRYPSNSCSQGCPHHSHPSS